MTEKERTGDGGRGQDKREEDMTGEDRTGQDRTGQDRIDVDDKNRTVESGNRTGQERR